MKKLTSLKNLEYRYLVAIIYASVLFLDRLDLTIVNISLPTLADYFEISISQTEWITNSFLLALAISIPISGWAGDKFGVKQVFIFATSLYGFFSFLCAFSPNIYMMTICRFLQGIGGGLIIPVGMTMVYQLFDYAEYASITSYIFLPTLIAPAIAPLLGGIIIQVSNWKWVFLFGPPICFIAVIISIFLLKEQKQQNPPPLDWGGFFSSSLSLVLILYTISLLSQNYDVYNLLLLVCIIACTVGYFIIHEKKITNPLIDLAIFKNNLFVKINLIQLTFQICHFGAIFLIGAYLQIGIGMSPFFAGLIMGMQAWGAMLTSRFSVKLFNSYGPSLPITVGLLGVAILTTSILLINDPNKIVLGCGILFLRGIFSGLCGTPIQTASVLGFDKSQISRVNAIFNASRQISISIGVALSSMLIAHGFKISHVANDHTFSAIMAYQVFHLAFFVNTAIALIGIAVTATINRSNKK